MRKNVLDWHDRAEHCTKYQLYWKMLETKAALKKSLGTHISMYPKSGGRDSKDLRFWNIMHWNENVHLRATAKNADYRLYQNILGTKVVQN